MTGSLLRLGVLGATSMVYRAAVARAIGAVERVQVVHEASASGEGQLTGVRQSSDYRAVLADPDVDAVYLPLPNHLHEEWVLACATAGKHVLCEKPLGIDAASAQRMVRACAQAGVVLMEAYMSPFHPRSQAVTQAVRDGVLGRVLHGETRMSGVLPQDNHRWQVSNGGGALLDVGIYCLEPVLSAFGWEGEEPVEVRASSIFAADQTGADQTGVDETTSAWLSFEDGRTLHLWVSFAAPDQQRLALTGSRAAIEVDVRHATPDRRDQGYELRQPDGSVQRIKTGTGDCYEGMVAHFRDVVTGVGMAGGVTLARSGARSVAVARLVDQIADAAGHQRRT